MGLEKFENLAKGGENPQHSQPLNNVSQGLEFLKVSIKNTRIPPPSAQLLISSRYFEIFIQHDKLFLKIQNDVPDDP